MTSIWRDAYRSNIDETFKAFANAQSSQEFYAAAAPIFAAVTTDPEEMLSEALGKMDDQIAAFESKGGPLADVADMMRAAKEDILADMETDYEAYEDEDDDHADGNALEDMHPIYGGDTLMLAESHMFFDSPYAEIPYEEIDKQVATLLQQYETALSNALGAPAQHLTIFGNPNDGPEAEELWFARFESEPGYALGNWHRYWIANDWVFYLSHEHEDKELPIQIGFGRVKTAAFDQAVSDIQAIKA